MQLLTLIFSSLIFLSPLAAASSAHCDWINDYVERVPNFPIEGIDFLCYPELLQSPDAFHALIEELAKHYEDQEITKIVGLEARGFPFGAALAYEMRKPFVMVRKKGKLPRETKSVSYGLEYGSDVLEVECESLKPTDRVLIVDDLLATGGTANAAIELVEGCGSSVCEVVCIFEIENLDGRSKVNADVFSAVVIPE